MNFYCRTFTFVTVFLFFILEVRGEIRIVQEKWVTPKTIPNELLPSPPTHSIPSIFSDQKTLVPRRFDDPTGLLHRVKRDKFWKKLGNSIEKGFHKVRDAALPQIGSNAGTAVGTAVGGALVKGLLLG